MNVVVNGILTSYIVQGEGPLMLILHGWGDRASSFAAMGQVLAQQYRVVAVDLPGFGGSDAPKDGAWGLDDYARFVAAFLRKINAGPLDVLVGHSNGGTIAVRGVSSGLLVPKRLVLLASAGVRADKARRRGLVGLLAKVGKIFLPLFPKSVQSNLRQRLYGALGSELMLVPHMEATFKKIVPTDVVQEAEKITVPTLLVYGTADDTTPVAHGQQLAAAITHSKLDIIDGGHLLHIERPNETTELMIKFLKRAES